MLNQIFILNPSDINKFKFFEELGCHKERLVYVLVKAKKIRFSYFKYEIQIEIIKPLFILLLFQKYDPVGLFYEKRYLGSHSLVSHLRPLRLQSYILTVMVVR